MSTLIPRNLYRSSRLLRTHPLRITTPTTTTTPLRIQMSRSTIQQRTLTTETTTETAQKETPPCGDRCTCDYDNEKNNRSYRWLDIAKNSMKFFLSTKTLIELYDIKTKPDDDDMDTASESEASEFIAQ